jgi:hypothetical protein
LQHVVIPEAQDAIALRFKKPGPRSVRLQSFRVLPAIHFDNQLRAVTGEIDDVGTDPHLPPKMHTRRREMMAQVPSQFPLRVCRLRTHLGRALAVR